jgi:uncharacterized delta-60 repeat protein
MPNIVKIGNVVANSIERISSVESSSIVNLEGSTFIQDMDNIIIGGAFSSMNPQTSNVAGRNISRINTDGSIDSTFSVGTGFIVAQSGISNGSVNRIVTQADGKIIIAGSFGTYRGLSQNRIARLNTDGSLDSTFSIGTGLNFDVFTMVMQSDGKVLVGGQLTAYNGVSQRRIARLNTDGSLDSTFDIGTGFNVQVWTIALQTDGKILVGGDFTTYKGLTQNRIARLNTDGSLDSTFDVGTGFNSTPFSIAVQSDGKILVGGDFTTYKDLTQNNIARLNTDGSLDSSFVVGTGFGGSVKTITLQSDGKILAGGSFTTYNGTGANRIIRLNSNGSIDTSFVYGSGFNGVVNTIEVTATKIIVGGENFTTYNGLSRNGAIILNTNGVADILFYSVVNTNGSVGSVSVVKALPDGKILIGGTFPEVFVTPVSRLLKINSDNSLDLNFNLEGEFNSSTVFSQLRQTDGKFIMAGSFTTYKGLSQNRIIRFNSDGSLDSSFDIGTGFGGDVNVMALQTDGKIIVGGAFTTYKGLTQTRIARLNSDGSLDSSFVVGTGFGGSVNALSIQSDGKILVGGNFTTYKSLTQNRIARLNTDASLDSEFIIGAGFNGIVNALLIQANGKIIAGGQFTTYKGLTQNRIARLNTDGSLDSEFVIGTGFDSFSASANTISIQSDGKILVGGNFSTYKSLTQNNIARLNTAGSLDSTFDVGTGFGLSVNTIVVQTNGKILVGGILSLYKGQSPYIPRIARINANGSLDKAFTIALNSTVNTILKY